MEQTKEAVYLINDDKYLHLRENGAGVGFATYNKVTVSYTHLTLPTSDLV